MTACPPAEAQSADLLIEARWIIPVEPAGVVLENHALVVRGGQIAALLPLQEARQRFSAAETVVLPRHVLLPGLINLHTHAAMALLRGYADDLPLMRWLQERIWPAEGQHVGEVFVRDGTLLAAWEMLRGGITCFSDMYFYPDAAAEAATEAGIRAMLGIAVLEFPSAYANDADDYLAKGLAVRDRYRQTPLIGFTLAPHAPYTVADRTFERIATLAAQLDLPIHTHIHETADEIRQSIQEHGIRPLARLARLGLLQPGFIGVHGVHLEPGEIALLAEHGCSLAHCPTSNLKLASGIAPLAEATAAGLRVGLGTDGAASNNRLDLLQEMRHAALLAKGASGDATVAGAHQILRMATLDGAAALGRDRELGSLLPGKAADFCALSLEDWMVGPCFDPASHLVYTLGREQVSHVWVAGKQRICNGRPVDLDPLALLDKINLWHTKLS